MSILKTGREAKIAAEYNGADKEWANIISRRTVSTDLTVNATAWLHDNIQNSRGDVSEDDRVAFRAAFEEKLAQIQLLVDKLNDCYGVYNQDPTTYQANLVAFLAKYPAANPEEFDKRFK